MSQNARIFLVGSILLTGLTVFGVNYYNDQEKQRKRLTILADISRRQKEHRSNMEQYEKQLKLQDQLRLRDQ